MRLGIAFIWLWTAFVSWFCYPKANSLEWLHRAGITQFADIVLVAACLFDLALGIASCFMASALLWRFQFLAVSFYSVVLAFALPEFWIHPFGPLTKNIAVLACLACLSLMESTRSEPPRQSANIK